jgi:hypothetical protein
MEQERENMTKVNVIYDIEHDYLIEDLDKKYEIKTHKDKGKNVKISNKLFELMKSEGFIEKIDDGYVFVGKEKDLREFRKQKD